MKDLDVNAIWWLPEVPDDTMTGRLTFNVVSGASLELIGCFEMPQTLTATDRSQQERTILGQFSSPEVVHGIATNGVRITLYRVVQTGSQIGNGPPVSRFAPTFVLMGAHVTIGGIASVRSVSATFSELFEWAGVSVLQQTLTMPAGNEGQAADLGVRWEYVPQTDAKRHVAALPFGTVDLIISAEYSIGSQPEMHVSQQASLRTELSTPVSLEQVLEDIVFHLHHFVTLGVGAPIVLESLSLTCPGDDGLAQADGGEAIQHIEHLAQIAVYYRGRRTAARRKEDKPIQRHDMAFRLPDIANEWSSILNRYFETLERYRPVYDLYFATIYAADSYLQNRFLNFAQAIESFHRRREKGTLLPPETFRDIKSELVACLRSQSDRIPNEIRATFASRLQYFNEYTLNERLLALFPDSDEVLQDLTGGTAEFRIDMRNTRNFLTHYTEELEAKASTGVALVRLTMRMQAALSRLFLQELGIPERFVESWTRKQIRRIEPIRSIWESTGP